MTEPMRESKVFVWPCKLDPHTGVKVHGTRGGVKTLCGRPRGLTSTRRTFQNYAATYPNLACKTCVRAVGEGNR